MPNIVLVGFDKNRVKWVQERTDFIIRNMGLSDDAITTILPAETKLCRNKSPAPFLIVRGTNGRKIRKIAKALHFDFNADVEVEKINGFFSSGFHDKT